MQAGGHRFDPDRLHQFFGLRGRPLDDIPKSLPISSEGLL